ncbi:type II secretion system major pseudopilin GspG [Lentisphaerota bacterium ZTH]|nr:type II secretion system major pseudopilin GspG [Lentisphaerota bacterium]WET06718.1 type II secretion system major pseudopilin GspG [Lentisphaerota bacterium ZTH]
MKNRKQLNKNWFTMIEMVVVIVIIALLASIATPLYFRHVKRARVSAARTQIRLLEQAVFDFRLDMGRLPDASYGLKELVSNVNNDSHWDGPYLKQGLPSDPWGRPYVYKCPGEHGEFDIMSYGADGQPGGTGENADVGNWLTTQE